VTVTGARDEYRHPAAPREAWAFDAFDVAAGFGVVVRLTFRAADRVAWWWAGAVGCGPELVALRATDIDLPRRGTTVRTDGLWASLECEEPLVHWSLGMECFAVAYDDPWEAARSERGDVVPFGLELSFVTTSPPAPLAEGYEQWCTVAGSVLLGDATLDVDCAGHRAHGWGTGPLPSPYVRARGTVAPGAPVAVSPFLVPGGVWVESLCRAVDGDGGWSGSCRTA